MKHAEGGKRLVIGYDAAVPIWSMLSAWRTLTGAIERGRLEVLVALEAQDVAASAERGDDVASRDVAAVLRVTARLLEDEAGPPGLDSEAQRAEYENVVARKASPLFGADTKESWPNLLRTRGWLAVGDEAEFRRLRKAEVAGAYVRAYWRVWPEAYRRRMRAVLESAEATGRFSRLEALWRLDDRVYCDDSIGQERVVAMRSVEERQRHVARGIAGALERVGNDGCLQASLWRLALYMLAVKEGEAERPVSQRRMASLGEAVAIGAQAWRTPLVVTPRPRVEFDFDVGSVGGAKAEYEQLLQICQELDGAWRAMKEEVDLEKRRIPSLMAGVSAGIVAAMSVEHSEMPQEARAALRKAVVALCEDAGPGTWSEPGMVFGLEGVEYDDCAWSVFRGASEGLGLILGIKSRDSEGGVLSGTKSVH